MRFFGLQLCPRLLLDCLRLAVDFSLQLLHVIVDARDLDTKIFTKLIDAFAYDHSPYDRPGKSTRHQGVLI
jgi:hypothetical protein